MAEPKKIKTRIIQKHATAAVWSGTSDKFTPLEGEIIVYDTDSNNTCPRLKIGNGSNNVNVLDYISKGMVDNSSLTYNNQNGTISLNKEYVDYLDSKLYAYPSIDSFNIVGSNVEVGKTVTVSSFTHKESNTKNIDGNLVLTSNKDTSIKLNVTPSESSASVAFSNSYTFKTNTTLTYTLTLTDTRGNVVSKTDSVSAYYPSFVGSSSSSSVTSADILNAFTKVASASLAGSRDIPANSEYVYFVSTTAINKITSGGFDVSYSRQEDVTVDINGVIKSYYVYRTDSMLTEKLNYVIS